MFLSVIIPVYNAEKYLSECLDSLIEQDISKEDYEIICVNDGSTDNSLQILEAYELKNPNIIVINQSNKGVCQARNAGLDIAQGDYIWFIDADDFIQSNAFAELKDITKRSHCDMLTVGCYSFFEELSEKEKVLKNNHEIRENIYSNSVWAHLFRSAFLRANGLYFKYLDLAYCEDSIFVYEVKRAKPIREGAKNIIYYYRKNSNSVTMKKAVNMYRIESHIHAAKIAKSYYDEGDRNSDIADLWMVCLWGGLASLAFCSRNTIKKELEKLKNNNEWPVRRPRECTIKKSYNTTRTDLIGKIYDWLYIHTHTYIGFYMMRLYGIFRSITKR